MPVLDVGTALLELMLRASRGSTLAGAAAGLQGACVTTVLAAAGYPETPRTGDVDHPAARRSDGVIVFHAGTTRDADGRARHRRRPRARRERRGADHRRGAASAASATRGAWSSPASSSVPTSAGVRSRPSRPVPELPETETIARDLDRELAGRTHRSTSSSRRADVLREVDADRARAARVRGATIVRCWRRAKLVVLDLDSGDRIVVQPRFTGALLLSRGALPERRGALLHACTSRSTTAATCTTATSAGWAPSSLMDAGRFDGYSGGARHRAT